MTPRENLLSCLRRQGYERVPYAVTLSPEMAVRFAEATGENDPDEATGMPIRLLYDGPSPRMSRSWVTGERTGERADAWTDGWGIVRRITVNPSLQFLTNVAHPLEHAASAADVEGYAWPEVDRSGDADARTGVEAIHDRGLAAAAVEHSVIWEAAWYLRGLEGLMVDMGLGDPKAHALFANITRVAKERVARLASFGIDILMLTDDIGLQHSLMMGIELWRKWIQPRLAEVIAAAREAAPGELIVYYHSCGAVEPAVPGLIEAGVDVLNPVSPQIFDFPELHAAFGDRLSFWGGVDSDTLLAMATPDEIRAAVAWALDVAGPAGGLVPAPTHVVDVDVPMENLLAFLDACRSYTPDA